MTEAPLTTPLLEMRSISKRFPGVLALDNVNLEVRAGEIHALVGENGAGKSTLMKILGGAYSQYEGEILIGGVQHSFQAVGDATRAGIAVVFQELSLVPELTVGENIFLGREPARYGLIRWHELHAQAAAVLRELGFQLNTRAQLSALGTGQQQMVEIAKALSQHTRILVLDEPTAALTNQEAEHLFGTLTNLLARGMAIVYISHRLEEVFRISDRITVMRDGKAIATHPTSNVNEPTVIAQMVGREVSKLFPAGVRTKGKPALQVGHLSAVSNAGKQVLKDVSFTAHAGQVLGIAGLMGAGRTALLMSLFGAWRGQLSAEILVDGKAIALRSPAEAVAHGIALVTEDRKRSGLVLNQPIVANMTLAALRRIAGRFVTSETREMAATRPLLESLRIKAQSPFTNVGTLSGGNQQKVALGKWLLTEPKILLLDEPTRGIDVGAKQEIYALIDDLARSGLAIVMVSSELPEVLGLSDRVFVLHKGRITGDFLRAAATPEAVMACATGHHGAPEGADCNQ
jgi:D-xylose transport system ATP-binding protein